VDDRFSSGWTTVGDRIILVMGDRKGRPYEMAGIMNIKKTARWAVFYQISENARPKGRAK
jgi:hypothetical protein